MFLEAIKEGFFDIRENGDIYRVKRIYGGKVFPCAPVRITTKTNWGYGRVSQTFNGASKTIAAHKLVWMAFNGLIPPPLQINHKNGIKNDNRLCNLEVVTPSENTLHAFRVLKVSTTRGEKQHCSVLREDQVSEIFMLRGRISATTLSAKYGVHQATIRKIWRGALWNWHTNINAVPVDKEADEPFYSSDPELNEALKLDDQKLRDLGYYGEEADEK